MLRRRRLVCLAVCGLMALICGGAKQALAGPLDSDPDENAGGVEFRWDAPSDGCPGEDEVVTELERLLGGPVAEQGDRRLAAIARVRRETDGAWDLRLWTITNDATRQRSMVGEDCEVLAEAAALLAAMAIDPTVLERMGASEAAVEQAEHAEEVEEVEDVDPVESPEPEPEPEPPRPTLPEPEPEPPPQPEPERVRRFLLGVRVHSGISYGDLPGVGPLLRVALAMQWDRARVELEAHYGFLRRARFDDIPDRGADLRDAFASVRGCGLLRAPAAKLEFPICAGFEAGAQLGVGAGLITINEGAIPWLALDLAPGLVWAPIPNFALGLAIEPWVALMRPHFEAEGIGELWRPLPVGVRVLAGVEARF